MGYNFGQKKVKELWAIVDKDGLIFWSRGGSSTSPKIMVYDKKISAERALGNNWTKQIINANEIMIKKIYEIKLKD